MSALELGFERILKWEGYASNDPDDPGGLTFYGIASHVYPQDVQAMAAMPKEQRLAHAKGIYRRDYYDKIQGDQLERLAGEELAVEVFDFAVNAGVGRAVITLQKLLNCMGAFGLRWPVLTQDGQVGIETLTALEKAVAGKWGRLLPMLYRSQRAAFYLELGSGNPKNKFLKGWLNRTYDL